MNVAMLQVCNSQAACYMDSAIFYWKVMAQYEVLDAYIKVCSDVHSLTFSPSALQLGNFHESLPHVCQSDRVIGKERKAEELGLFALLKSPCSALGLFLGCS